MEVQRSISLYGLSDLRLTFEEETDDYFARQVVFQRIADAQLPAGVTPSMAPLFSPSGLVYRYVLESPDRSPQELKIFEDWVVERAYRQVPGVADDSGFGGTTMQYQVLLDPARIFAYHITVPMVVQQFIGEQREYGRRILFAGRAVLLRARAGVGEGHARYREHSGRNYERRSGAHPRHGPSGDRICAAAWRIRIRQSRRRQGQSNDDAVEGVILMRRGEQTQTVLKGVEAKTNELNTWCCRRT